MPLAMCPPARQTNHQEGLGPSSQRPPSQKCNLQSPKQACFRSTIFPVPNSTWGNKVIMNLSNLTIFNLAPRFHTTNIHSLVSLLQPPVWLASLDIQDVYFTSRHGSHSTPPPGSVGSGLSQRLGSTGTHTRRSQSSVHPYNELRDKTGFSVSHKIQPLLQPRLLDTHKNRDRKRSIPSQFKTALPLWLEPYLLKQSESFL